MLKRDVVILNRYAAVEAAVSHGKAGFAPGDVIAVKSPVDPSSLVIKRLVALPGSIVKTLDPYPEKTVRIPPGHCWIEGDEQYHSRDSNTYGPVPLGLVNAKVEWIVWPPSRIGRVAKAPPGLDKRVVTPRTDFVV